MCVCTIQEKEISPGDCYQKLNQKVENKLFSNYYSCLLLVEAGWDEDVSSEGVEDVSLTR